MSKEGCLFCRSEGKVCERPNTVGEAIARLEVGENRRQYLVLEPIEKCTKRLGILGQTAEMLATSR